GLPPSRPGRHPAPLGAGGVPGPPGAVALAGRRAGQAAGPRPIVGVGRVGLPVVTRPIRVMVVDDTDHVRRMLTSMLSLDGFEVVGNAADGPQAIENVEQADPDVVVVDYKMPGMD